jgi:transcription-repair coupling factor (superfamily II helicase)
LPHYLLEKWHDDPSFLALQKPLSGPSARLVTGMEGSQRSFFIAALYVSSSFASLVLTANMARAEKIYEEVGSFVPAEELYLFPARDFFYAGEVLTTSKEIPQQRIRVLERLALGKKILVIAPVAALLGKLIPKEQWEAKSIVLRPGARVEWEAFLKQLIGQGYERCDLVETEGSFSVRGDIIDIFPYYTQLPVRISFFDEEVESLRYFDPESQRSREVLPELAVFPAREVVLTSEAARRGKNTLLKELGKVAGRLKGKGQEEAADRLGSRVESQLAKLESDGTYEGIEQYLTYFYPRPAGLLDYFPAGGTLFWDEPASTLDEAESLRRELHEYQSGLLIQGDILPGQVEICWSPKEIFERITLHVLAMSAFTSRVPLVRLSGTINIPARPLPSFMGRLDLLKQEVKGWWSEGHEVFVMCEGEARQKEIGRLLRDHDFPVYFAGPDKEMLLELAKAEMEAALEQNPEVYLKQNRAKVMDQEKKHLSIVHPPKKVRQRKMEKRLMIVRGNLENGFLFPSLNLVILVDKEIIPRRRKQKTWARSRGKAALRDFQELKTGDLVVHEQHGIGRYMGMQTLDVDGITRDYLYIKYAGEDRLYLPVEQMDTLQRYTGGEGRAPRVHALGGQEWSRVKNRVRASVQELARELLTLYAAREATKGFAFSPDQAWQKDFEGRFIYEETPDQLRAIEEVKGDMQKPMPMDRLLCGDVGYGKTEVAIRAAFKAVLDGKQVAFLVPTTILAQQHYENFLERFEGFPVKIDLLSRFRGAKEQKEVIKALKAGVVDIVIGTHRLISKDIGFKDLGLLIIDEEHRFGVRHKERLKMLRQDVDVLSMTATPIPRTMHMALSGARDLSVIDTPPENRYPVQTYIAEYSHNMIKEAIQRELNRGGQVYFIYNRVQTIEKWAEKLRELIPGARIAMGHGQMPEHQLEKIMHGFMQGDYDVLICTTIVEAGLDIPNVNTMIVYDADFFGLAQLYQLRGRVGRSNRLAYCYLTYRKDKVMTEDAVKRLQAIKEFTQLGSGFKIALRDMEIRGAGNILGPEQHGFMMAVGYELYCSLLEQAIETMKGRSEPIVREIQPRINLHVNAFLPSAYVPNQQQKIELYRRIAVLENKEELKDMISELRDRYGRLQPPVENLLLVMRLRQLAREKNIESIEQQKEQTLLRFRGDKNFDIEKLWGMVNTHRRNISLKMGKQITLRLKNLPREEKKYLNFIIAVLEEVI